MYRVFLLFILSFHFCVLNLHAQDFDDAIEVKLTEDEIAGFRQQAEKSVKDLSRYLNIIADKNKELVSRNNAIDLAIVLFISENNVVQISSKLNDIKTLKIRAYFNKIKSLPYKSVRITWYKIFLSKDIKEGPDGKYYGTATIFQKFEGTYNNEMGGYKDITKKSIQIVVEKVAYKEGLLEKERWVLKLGDINVEETK